MIKPNFSMRRVNNTEETETIHVPYFDIDQIETDTTAKPRMENLESRERNNRWIGTLGNINF